MIEKELTDNEIDEFVTDELQKDITQEDSIDPSVDEHLSQMGFLWDRAQVKLQKDNLCFICKNKLIIEEDDKKVGQVFVVEATNVEPGVIAFIRVCSQCYNKELENGEDKNE